MTGLKANDLSVHFAVCFDDVVNIRTEIKMYGLLQSKVCIN